MGYRSKQQYAQVPYGYKEKDSFIVHNVQEKDEQIKRRINSKTVHK